MKYRLLFTDIDGTLMCPERKFLTKQCIHILRTLQEKGIYVIPATGRGFKAIRPEVLGGIVTDYSICHNGACVLNRDGQILYGKPMSMMQLKLLCDMAAQNHYSLGFSFSDGYYTYYKDAVFREFYRENNGDMECLLDGTDHLRHHKDMPYSGWGMVPREMAEKFNRQNTGLYMVPFKDTSHDICQEGINKKTGADFLLQHLGIDWKETIAIGDGANDYELLQSAGIGIAMGNAAEELKQVAHMITGSVTEDGAVAALMKMFQL